MFRAAEKIGWRMCAKACKLMHDLKERHIYGTDAGQAADFLKRVLLISRRAFPTPC